ncbi:hypothetical protein DY000_02018636 [Brassica cretica]|uniref:Arabidopsis retrotransposon Orf1 C-terminal domain-containing protein n=1 Tax=Brassica cretica TaxID=69181 RepID=A0ABQ7CUW3_BRACR|nr:hypothetical protein DY000_02018636 [Brassica cretica]
MHSTHGSKLVMSPRKTCDCSARLSAPTPHLERCPFQATTSMLPSGWRDDHTTAPILNVPLGKDSAGPKFIDGTYLRIATYFSGMYGKDYVYHYYLKGKPVEVVLPNQRLTSLERPGAISFNLSQEDFLGEHGSLGPIAAPRKRSVPMRHDFTEPPREESVPIYGPPRYYFKPHDGILPLDKCKALSKTVKKQAKTSAKFMKKVADVLTRGGIAGCSSADFAFANTTVPQPPPQPTDLGFPLTDRQLQRKWRNPTTQPSTSGNKSPSLASSESEAEIEELWKLITGNKHSTGADKNSHIRHPSVRYLHRMLVHAFYPRKQAGNVTEEDMRLLCPAIRPYAPPGTLPLPSNDIYASFGMVSFFVNRLEHYRDWAWYTTDSQPKVGIGGMITPLLQFLNVPLGKDAAGPKFIDGTYLRVATYFSGMYGKDYVYHYCLQGKPVEVVLPNQRLTSLERHGAISFNLSQEDFLGEHGSLGPIAAPRKRSAPTRHDFTEPPREESVPIYGPPHYYFKPHDGVLPPGALRDAHDYIGRLQRWNKAQDRTIKKLKDKCKALSKMVKKQAKTSAKFMKKVADVLTRGGIAGCSPADFAFANTSVPQPPPQPTDLGFPLTGRQLQRKWRNPPTQPSACGNKSPSLASSESEAEIEEVQSQQLYGDSSSGHGDVWTSDAALVGGGSETSGLATQIVWGVGAETFAFDAALEGGGTETDCTSDAAYASCVFMLELNFHSGSSNYSSQWFACLTSHTSRSDSPVAHPSSSHCSKRATQSFKTGSNQTTSAHKDSGIQRLIQPHKSKINKSTIPLPNFSSRREDLTVRLPNTQDCPAEEL